MNKDLIESFLSDGLPDPPESRATKSDLERHIKERDVLLGAIRGVMLDIVAAEYARAAEVDRAKEATLDSLTDDQLAQMVGPPDGKVEGKVCTPDAVCGFIEEIGASSVISVTAHSDSFGPKFTVFYRG